ncbi:SNF1-related protein kinase regulatory subunit gamma-like PV42a [Cynara cardunculus var. scolymus]|uniref:SNF1-related protein kinase regulatory subunit gamma-like PV42a n=1 Tax=Cynara cardunculus var. scolymus TaxID=59895 RepID=UPI000D628773|nr:SNF1-related protein kinase regulatory subunit gamma-like PV42a [Cynara cardunculus var. scolymus]
MQTTMMGVKTHGTIDSHRLKDKKVKELVSDKRRLVEVPYTATLAHTMNALVANQVVAVPVAAPPGHWIGAGGSMILESDKHTGAVRKHYIGMVTMLDILAHIAGDSPDGRGSGGEDTNLEQRMAVPVSSVIGHCLESLSLWTLNPGTSILDCMEVFSKGIHRALVPVDSSMENVAGVELVESASSYRMVTQMDLMKFLKGHESELKHVMERSLRDVGALVEPIFGVTDHTKVIDAIKSMRAGSLNAVPIVESSDPASEDHSQLVNGKGRKLIGTFSATDLRECPASDLQSWMSASVMEYTRNLVRPSSGGLTARELVTCYAESLVAEVVEKVVVNHVHRVWVVDRDGLLDGLVSLTDIIRVIRSSLLE